MLVARFGDAWGSAYVFPTLKAVDNWQAIRPPVIQRVSGAGGAFDFFGDENYPNSPITVRKKVVLEGSSYSNVETLLNTMRAQTIAAGKRKLWGLWRDGSTHVWNWAKCTKFQAAESVQEKTSVLLTVDLEFLCPDGLWYGETQQEWTETMVIPASTIGQAVTGLTNDGNVDALVDVRISPQDGLTVEDCAAGVRGVSQWEFAGDFTGVLDAYTHLFVTASIYECVTNLIITLKDDIVIALGSSVGVWGDGTFVYSANTTDGIHSYSVNVAGVFTHLDSDDQGDSAQDIWGDGRFVYLANDTGGIHSYSVDGAGNFTHLDSDDQGDTALGVWGDGNFIYLANGAGGLATYSVDALGNLTFINSDATGGTAFDVWGDGTYIYVANFTGGIDSYSVDDSGIITRIDSDDQGGFARGVWGDGTYIYLANDSDGLLSYSADADGNLTFIDSDDQGDNAYGVWGDGTYIYVASDVPGIHVYTVNAVGELTHLQFASLTQAFGVWGDGTFVYLANSTTLRSYDMGIETDTYTDLAIGEGDLLSQPDINQLAWLWIPPGTWLFRAIVDCDGGGAAEEVDVFVKWWDTYVL